MAEFVVAHILDDYQQGDRFTVWPLHVTVLPPFEAPSAEAVSALVEAAVGDSKPISLRVGEKAHLGANTLVQKIIPSPELQSLHFKVLQAVESQGWSVNGRYTGSHYTPHITEKSGRSYGGVSFTVDSIVIVENIGQGYRVIGADIRLGAQS